MKITEEQLAKILDKDRTGDEQWKWHISAVKDMTDTYISEAKSKPFNGWDPKIVDDLLSHDNVIAPISRMALTEKEVAMIKDYFYTITPILKNIANSKEKTGGDYKALDAQIQKYSKGAHLLTLTFRYVVAMQPDIFSAIMNDDMYDNRHGFFALTEKFIDSQGLPKAKHPIDRHNNWYDDNIALTGWVKKITGRSTEVTTYALHIVHVLRELEANEQGFAAKYKGIV